MHGLSEWIYGTALSATIRDHDWVVPVVQSLHIIAIAVVMGAALVTELRVLGIVAPDESLTVVARRYLPWMWRSLAVLFATGVVMIIGEPERTLSNTTFWIKMALVSAAFVASLAMRRPLLSRACAVREAPAKGLAWILLAVWVAVIFCGRWIAYS